MDLSTSECSSGCESGWTMYFDQYSDSADQFNKSCSKTFDDHHQDLMRSNNNNKEDEDLSMVSDASSGPPHFHDDENCFVNVKNGTNISYSSEKIKGQQKKNKGKEQNSFLDDTASSHAESFSKNVPSYSQGLSATDPKEKSTLRKQFGFSKPSVKGKSTSEKSGGLQGRKKW